LKQSQYHPVINIVLIYSQQDGTLDIHCKDAKRHALCLQRLFAEIILYIPQLSISKDQYLDINLNECNAKDCFKYLKGIAAPTLHTLTPIKPIVKLNYNDDRFIDSEYIIHTIDDSKNIAMMNWKDFEHLIRELFEKEFSRIGGKVKVTQASRDGGVDAIIFDPDPITGGKIII